MRVAAPCLPSVVVGRDGDEKYLRRRSVGSHARKSRCLPPFFVSDLSGFFVSFLPLTHTHLINDYHATIFFSKNARMYTHLTQQWER